MGLEKRVITGTDVLVAGAVSYLLGAGVTAFIFLVKLGVIG